MSNFIRRGSVFSLKQPYPIFDNKIQFEIPSLSTGSVLSPALSDGKKVVHIQMAVVSPSGVLVDLHLPAEEILTKFNRVRATRDKVVKDWNLAAHQSYRETRISHLLYLGNVVATVLATKDEGVLDISFEETDAGKTAQIELDSFISVINLRHNAKNPVLNQSDFINYFFFNFNTHLTLDSYVQMLIQQRQRLQSSKA